MIKYISIILATGIVVVTGCKPSSEKEIVEMPVLRASSLFNDDSVYTYLHLYEDIHGATSNYYIEKAEAIAESNPQKAIYYYKRSLTVHPSYGIYKKLGGLLMKEGMYSEADRVYSFITRKAYTSVPDGIKDDYLFQAPDEDLYYEYMLASTLSTGYFDNYFVYQAKDLNFDINKYKERLSSDPRLKFGKSSETYKNMMLAFMSDEEIEEYKRSPEVFSAFLSSIPDSSLQFIIDGKKVQDFDYSRSRYDGEGDDSYSISDFYIWFLKETEDNSNNWYDYNFKNVHSIGESVKAVLYSIDTSAISCPKEMRHIYWRVVTYGKDGKIIDSKVVATQAGEELKTAKINNDQITVSEFKRTWSKPYDKNDFDNDLKNTELVNTKSFKIKPTGEIVESINEESTNTSSLPADSTI
jgi:hypothetical protein